MKIQYRFVTGEVLDIEVNEELGAAMADMEKTATNSDRTETRRHASLEMLMEKGYPLEDKQGLAEAVEQFMLHEQLYLAIAQLQPRQRELLQWVFVEHRTHSEIARSLGVTPQAIDRRVNRMMEKLKKILLWGLEIAFPVASK